jgi:hypothetical protein
VCGVEEVLLTKLREGGLGIATYVTCQLKWSCLDRVSELGEVESVRRCRCRSPRADLEVATLWVPWAPECGGVVVFLLRSLLDHALTWPAKIAI